MNADTVGFIIAIVIAAIVAFPLSNALRRNPGVFYAAAALAVGVYIWAQTTGIQVSTTRPLMAVISRGYLASAFLAIVMFTGCFDTASKLRRILQPNRGSLSILSFIFILGHLFTYLPAYIPHLTTIFAQRGNIAASLIVSCALTLLFALLTITSLRVVRDGMNPRVWKNLQRFAYVMVGLLLVHIALVLGRSALNGGVQAAVSLTVYGAVILLYVILRIRRAIKDRTAGQARL